MRILKSLLFTLVSCCGIVAQSKPETPNFPTDEEIQLALSQAERAFEQYERSIMLEANLPSMQADKSGLERDRQVVSSAKKLITGLKKRPQAFHGTGGLLLLSVLDDGSRNAALCNGSVFADISSGLLSGNGLDKAKAYELMQIGQACTDSSAQLYTVSENVQALLIRELDGQQMINQKAMDALNQCTGILKQMNKSPSANGKH